MHIWLIGWTGKLQVDIQLVHPLEGFNPGLPTFNYTNYQSVK
jgi:hypothetical protein